MQTLKAICQEPIKKDSKKRNLLFLLYCLFSYPIILKDGSCYKGTRHDLDTIEPYTTGTSDSHTDSSEIVSKL